MRGTAILACGFSLVGCYSASPPTANYLCTDTCPGQLQCVCGMCVNDASEGPCSFDVALDDTTCAADPKTGDCVVTEGVAFNVTVKAHPQDATQASTYAGTVVIASSWGRAHYLPPQFKNGAATVAVTLDRATPNRTAATINVGIGSGVGESERSVIVDAPRFTVDKDPVFDTKSGWATQAIGYPSVDRVPGTETVYFSGVGASMKAEIGVATSPDGVAFTMAPKPIISPTGPNEFLVSPSVLRASPSEVQIFYSHGQQASTLDVWRSVSSDNGATFAAPEAMILAKDCAFCDPAFGLWYPGILANPRIVGGWLVFFTQPALDPTKYLIGVARTVDRGATWSVDEVPTPANGNNDLVNANLVIPSATRVIYDADARLYRMFYGQRPLLAADGCATEIAYATSAEGVFWTGSRRPVEIALGDVKNAAAHNPYQAMSPVRGLLPGAIVLSPAARNHITVWFSPIIDVNGFCLPVAIWRASRP